MDPHRNLVDPSKVLALRDLLRIGHERLVLAESCTAGLVAALLGQVPGISECLCGSMVVYQTPIKHQWLGIASEDLTDPSLGPVSARVTEALAKAILERTPQATIAAAITGHLGPSAPAKLDGVIYCSIATNKANDHQSKTEPIFSAVTKQFQLSENVPRDANDLDGRRVRQHEAAVRLIEHLTVFLRDREKPR